MKNPLRLALCCTALVGCLGAFSPDADAASCSTDRELQAFNTRVFQSELMVAALACGQQTHYNAFVKKFEPLLTERGKRLKGYFSRAYGRGAERELNSFVTRIANDAAQRGLQVEENAYCDETLRQFEQVLGASDNEVEYLIADARHEVSHGVDSCNKLADKRR